MEPTILKSCNYRGRTPVTGVGSPTVGDAPTIHLFADGTGVGSPRGGASPVRGILFADGTSTRGGGV